jgi:probable phosphoglycerate mutase
MTKIILTRHGHVEGINPERFRGRTDLSLTELGEAQARAVAKRVASAWAPRIVYTSPMRRCVVTAEAIAAMCRVSVEILDDLSDLDYGEWQWRTYAEVRAASPEMFSVWFATPHLIRFPGGESLQDLVARTADALRLVIARHGRATDTIVLVGHDNVNRALLLQLLDQPLSAYWLIQQHPCAINEIEINDSRIRVLRVNETAHLVPEGAPVMAGDSGH